jgi:hypothetical protein
MTTTTTTTTITTTRTTTIGVIHFLLADVFRLHAT